MQSRAKKYGHSCLICRRRKVRCDGGKPKCANCVRIGERCTYDEHGSTTTRLQNALSKAERRLENLAQDLHGLLSLGPTQCQEQLRSIVARLHHEDLDVGIQSPKEVTLASPNGTHTVRATSSLSFDNHSGPQHDARISDDEHDEEGYGSTSRFQIEEDQLSSTQLLPFDRPSTEQVDYHKRWLVSNARFHDSFEQIAYASLSSDPRVDVETATILLNIYWAWQAPLHNCVYRRSFFRDMVMKGPYYSDFLLFVIYSHASRHIQSSDPRYAALQQGEIFLERAKLLLLDESKKDRPAVPTIQGLLILGGRQCAIGKNSEGWLYTGMAIRMIKDLGLHLASRLPTSATEPDDLETQKRLYLSAYAWDKTISLCLGRPPSLTSMPHPDHCLYDRTDDLNPWQPFYLGELESIYAARPCYSSSTFSHFVMLSTIINDAYKSVFGPKSRHATLAQLKGIEARLCDFSKQLPVELRMDENLAESSCPPPHICCLNILYHTILILVYRPYFLNKNAYVNQEAALFDHAAKVCAREAAAVNVFFQAYGRCFANKNQTYLLSYCVYTAATIEVKQVSNSDNSISQAAVQRLATTLAMLEEEARQTPGIRRSVEIIKTRLHKDGQVVTSMVREPNVFDSQAVPANAHEPVLSNPAISPVAAQAHVGPDNFSTNGGDTSDSVSLWNHTLRPTNSIESMSHWPSDGSSFDLYSTTVPDVGGGFVPDTLSWYSSLD